MEDFTINGTLPLLALRKLALTQLAGIYFDVMYVKDLQKTWKSPVTFLLQSLCKGDLPLFLAHIRREIMRFPMDNNGQIQARYCAPLPDRVLASRLFNVAKLFLTPLVAAWHLKDLDDGFDLFYGLLLMPRYRDYQIRFQEDTVRLYEALAHCHLEPVELTVEPKLPAQEFDSDCNKPQVLPQLSYDTEPNTVYRTAELVAKMQKIKDEDEFAREHRQLFIKMYQKDEQLDLSLQLKLIAQVQYDRLIFLRENPEYLTECSIRMLDEKISSLSDSEYVSKTNDWLPDTQESELLQKEGLLKQSTIPGAMYVKQGNGAAQSSSSSFK